MEKLPNIFRIREIPVTPPKEELIYTLEDMLTEQDDSDTLEDFLHRVFKNVMYDLDEQQKIIYLSVDAFSPVSLGDLQRLGESLQQVLHSYHVHGGEDHKSELVGIQAGHEDRILVVFRYQ